MKDVADTTPTKRARKRRAKRRPRMHWGRLIVCIVIFAVIAVVGLVSGTIVAVSHNLPNIDAMKPQQLGQDTVIFDRNGNRIAELYGAVNRVVVPSRQIPEVMKNATVAIEDKRFYKHHGVDFTGIARALVDDIKAGHVVEGASTITEQYVKNAYIGDDPTLTRKLKEAVLAWELEDRWSKDKILTEYLNTVYYGAGAYGVQAAALTYFHKPVSKLTLPQAALLAALPKFPSEYSPITDPQVITERRNLVLDGMAQQGYITVAQAAAAKAVKLRVYAKPVSKTNDPAGYFVDYVTGLLVNRYGASEVYEGGLRVYTSIDMSMQQDAIAALKERLPSTGQAGALVAIDPTNGYIRVMSASTDFKTYKYGLDWQAQRQPGSTMKPFALIAAVEEHADPATTYYNSHPLHIYLGPGANPPYWDVYTAEKSSGGRMNLVQATLQSDNTVFAQLCLDLGPAAIVKVAHEMGVTTKLTAIPSIVLGSEDVNALEMADAYATMASEGVHHAPQAIEKVVFPSGKVVKTKIKGNRVLSAGVAYTVDKILEQNTSSSGGTAASMPDYYRGRSAGKTGTTDNYVDAWFDGFNPKLATAVWMGYIDSRPMPDVFGATYSLPIWGTFYNSVFGSTYIPDFATPAVMPYWLPWEGKYSKMAPSPSPSPSSGSPSPGPTHTTPATTPPTTHSSSPKPTTPPPTTTASPKP